MIHVTLGLAYAVFMMVNTSVVFAASASWSPVEGATAYKLYRAEGPCVKPGAYEAIQTYSVTTAVPIPEPAISGIYCYMVTALSGNLESRFSNAVEFNHGVSAPTTPENLVILP